MIAGTMQIPIPKVGERYVNSKFGTDVYIKVVAVHKHSITANYVNEKSIKEDLKFWYLEKYYRLASEKENEALKIKEMIG